MSHHNPEVVGKQTNQSLGSNSYITAEDAPVRAESQTYQKSSSVDKRQSEPTNKFQAAEGGIEAGKKMMASSFRSSGENIYNREFQKTMIKDKMMLDEYFSRIGKTGFSRTVCGGFYRRW